MENTQPPKKSRLTLYIIIALVVGIGLGFVLNKNYVADENKKLESIEVSLQQIQHQLSQSSDSIRTIELDQQKKLITKERDRKSVV